jgi:hypothetical protein
MVLSLIMLLESYEYQSDQKHKKYRKIWEKSGKFGLFGKIWDICKNLGRFGKIWEIWETWDYKIVFFFQMSAPRN